MARGQWPNQSFKSTPSARLNSGVSLPRQIMRKLLAVAALFPAFAVASMPPDSINDLFAGTCMKHFYSQDSLRKAMSDIGAPEAPVEKAEFFLAGKPGKAWFVVAPSTAYVVALRDDSVCAVFAQRANADQAHSGFSNMVGTAPEPLVATAQGATALGPQAPQTRTTAYSWSRSEDKDQLLFVLTTSDSADATAQAMVSMSLVGKANNSFKAMPLRGTP